MFGALAKALLLNARYYRRIALALERMERLYRLQLAANGITESTPNLTDEVEVSYGPKPLSADEQMWPPQS